jgi:dihydroorotate dehydrogenase (NAD+) catalytic subunit
MVNLGVRIGDIQLANPVMPASGTFAPELGQVIDLNRLGALVTKSITRDFRSGNPTPRVAEAGPGMLNSIGIPSKGIDHFLNEVVPAYRRYSPPLVASISADTPESFAGLCRDLSIRAIDAFEVNISCPNLKADGKAFAMHPDLTLEVMQEMRAATRKPLWAKLTPNVGNIVDIAKAAEEGGADALVIANAILSMTINTETLRPTLGSVMGGYSGPPVKPIILRMVYHCAREVSIPIIGVGGIETTDDAVQYLAAGASAIQVGTTNFVQPGAMIEIVEGLEAWCATHGIRDVNDLVGAVRDEGQDTDILEAVR